MVHNAMKCGAGTPSACRIVANVSEPLLSLEKPCCKKPNPTMSRSGRGAQREIGNRLNESSATSRTVVMLLPVNLFISLSFNGMPRKPHQADHAFFCGDGAIEPV